MTTTDKPIDKRTLLVSTALDLFYRHGIHAVGINEVLKASGVAKKTLYNHFSSKEALIAATVELRDQRFRHWMDEQLADVAPGLPAIEVMFQAMDDWFNERVPALGPFRGCFFINTSAEYSQGNCEIFAGCQRHKAGLRALVLKHLQVVVADNGRAEQLTDTVMLLKEGALVAAHLMDDKKAALKAVKTVKQLLATAAE